MNTYSYSLALAPVSPDTAAKLETLLAPIAELLEFAPRQVVCDLQDSGKYVYFLKSGKTAHYITDGVDEKLLYHLTAGRVFGNLSPANSRTVEVRAIALEKTAVLRAERAAYLKLLHKQADFALIMLTMQADFDQYLTREIDNLSFNSCKTRLMRIYCSQVDTGKVEDGKWYGLASKLTHNELAAIVGSARVTISKLINELCDDGFIRIINRRAQVNMAAYEKFLADHAED